ncbi:hypothetical protein [Bradyrhizobium brasilense]|uniref:Uncharacterized protein n=1 Tax=Bradyrhizobium brasilense TaxID=1419277 RepID=A0ABY8JPW3_9BRAD|nr:hypothetical protein [Bradyrhizobium brasilense]WFU67717.1 hypothetical protein QA636_20385 [Bradyrhizobium brasilense]
MLRSWLTYWAVFLAAVPGATGSIFALLEAANKTGFATNYPASHEKLVNSLNYLMYLLAEYWPGYAILCALAAFIWALIVVEPKAKSKRKYGERRLKLRR